MFKITALIAAAFVGFAASVSVFKYSEPFTVVRPGDNDVFSMTGVFEGDLTYHTFYNGP